MTDQPDRPPRGGDKSLVQALFFQRFFWDDECIVAQANPLLEDGLIIGIFSIAVVRQHPRTVFAVLSHVLLQCWVCRVLGLVRIVTVVRDNVAVFPFTGVRSALMTPTLGRFIDRHIIIAVGLLLFKCVHHVYII